MSYRRNRIGDRGWLFFMILFLVLMSWSQVIRQMNVGKARFDPWRLEPAWERERAESEMGRDNSDLKKK